MYIYNKSRVHSPNAAKGFVFSSPPSKVFCDSVTTVRLLRSITVPLAPTPDLQSPLTTDLIAFEPSEGRQTGQTWRHRNGKKVISNVCCVAIAEKLQGYRSQSLF